MTNHRGIPGPDQGPSWRARLLMVVYRHVMKRGMPRDVDLPKARAMLARLERWMVGRPGRVERIPVLARDVPAEWVRTGNGSPARIILYLHGGGFMFRTPGLHSRLAARLCAESDAQALVPQYRLAPEHPLPAAHEDCLAAYRWLLSEGHDPANIALAGDSAGGLLVLATLQRIRDAGLPAPSCGVMFSAGSDLDEVRCMDASATDTDPMISAGALELLQRTVIAPIAPFDAAVSPCAGSLHGLPPLLFQVGSTEVLFGQSRKAFEMARTAGTSAELQVWPKMPHVWQAVHWLPEARQALECAGEFLARHFAERGERCVVEEPCIVQPGIASQPQG